MTETILTISICELKTIRIKGPDGIIKECAVDRLTTGAVIAAHSDSSEQDALFQLAVAIQHLSRKDTKSDVEFAIVLPPKDAD